MDDVRHANDPGPLLPRPSRIPATARRTRVREGFWTSYFALRTWYFAEDMGGKVQALEVKESPTEVRIDLAADVLFDFDKADILPKAQSTLKQASFARRRKARFVSKDIPTRSGRTHTIRSFPSSVRKR